MVELLAPHRLLELTAPGFEIVFSDLGPRLRVRLPATKRRYAGRSLADQLQTVDACGPASTSGVTCAA